MKRMLRLLLMMTIALANVGCDQITKQVARTHLPAYQPITVLEPVLVLVRVENTGAFLSLGSTWAEPWRTGMLLLLPMIMLGFAGFYLFRNRQLSWLTLVAMACMIGGGVGNLYDRLRYGSVTDFLHLDFGLVKTGVFNAADMSIMLGGMLLLLEYTVSRRRPSRD